MSASGGYVYADVSVSEYSECAVGAVFVCSYAYEEEASSASDSCCVDASRMVGAGAAVLCGEYVVYSASWTDSAGDSGGLGVCYESAACGVASGSVGTSFGSEDDVGIYEGMA